MENVVLTVKNEPNDLPVALNTLKKQFSNTKISEVVRDQADDLLHQLTAYTNTFSRNTLNNSNRRLYETSAIVMQELERLGKYVADKKQFADTMEFLKERLEKESKEAFLRRFAALFGGKRRVRRRKTRRRG
jgi:hypothetical protein